MSVVKMQAADNAPDGAVSGVAMDRVVETRTYPRWLRWALVAAGLVVLVGAFWLYAPHGSSQTVAANRLTISPVKNGTFEDFIPLRARVTPLFTVSCASARTKPTAACFAAQ